MGAAKETPLDSEFLCNGGLSDERKNMLPVPFNAVDPVFLSSTSFLQLSSFTLEVSQS